MSLNGLPDFQQPMQADGFQIFFPYGKGEKHVLVPNSLEVATRDDGTPDFSLELVRGKNPLLPPTPYGVLDFRIGPRYQTEAALTLLRRRAPGAMLEYAMFAPGYLRFNPLTDIDFPQELLAPRPLAWNGLGIARTILKLSRDAATVLKDSLSNATLPLQASVELEIMGVSPRLPLRVRFNPARLLSALNDLGHQAQQVAHAEVIKFFQQSFEVLPLEIVGRADQVSPVEFAEVLTDHVRSRFGQFIPSPVERAESYFSLPSPEAMGSGTLDWDLSEAMQVARVFVFDLHPFEAARDLVKAQGLEAVLKDTIVPPLPTGYHTVSISANLPAERPGVESIGVTLRLPPKPPKRFQAVESTVELMPPEDRGAVLLKLSPAEKLEYTFRSFVVVSNANGIERYDGAPITHAGEQLDLGPGDFPVEFISLEASAGLLDLATMHGVCRWLEGAKSASQNLELRREHPAIAFALPKGVEDATLEIIARAREGDATLKLGPFPARDMQFDLHAFREYGPHTVEIECVFGKDDKLFAIELLAEGLPETPQEINVLHFAPTKPLKTWTYFAASPFQAGFRYRSHRAAHETTAPWSSVLSPFNRLRVNAAASAKGVS